VTLSVEASERAVGLPVQVLAGADLSPGDHIECSVESGRIVLASSTTAGVPHLAKAYWHEFDELTGGRLCL
jgi:hypothetical protein